MQQIQATLGAFAAIRGDGSVVTWGHKSYGGDSQQVQASLKHVKHIQASALAFAAILEDETVVTWGGEKFEDDLAEEGEEDEFLEDDLILEDSEEDYEVEEEDDEEGEEEDEAWPSPAFAARKARRTRY